MIKVVIDTNVALTGFLSYTNEQRKIINYAMSHKIVILGSSETYEEFKEKLDLPRFLKVASDFRFPRTKLLSSYKAIIRLISVNEIYEGKTFCKADPDDDAFIKVALSSGAKIIITHDKHLLDIDGIEGLKIVKPDKFVESFTNILQRSTPTPEILAHEI